MRNLFVLACVLFGLNVPVHGSSLKDYKLNHDHVPGQLIVKFKDNVPDELKANVLKTIKTPRNMLQSKSVTAVMEFPVILSSDGLLNIARSIDALPEVEYVEANNIWKLDEVIPNDPEFSKLYGLYNVNEEGQKTKHDISATLAWDITTGNKNVLVGIIDTGIDYNHPDLKDNIWTNAGETGFDESGNDRSTNGIDDDGNGYVDDWRGWDFYNNDNDPLDGHSHGTHCAGTIGAKGNNGVGIVGVSWDVSLVSMKVFSDSGSTTTEALAAAINYATTIGVDLTSNSWGGGAASDAIREAIQGADDAGILFVAAAGNSSSDNDRRPHYPSSYDIDNIIAVASTDRNDSLSSFSSYGLTSVDVAAPGSDIYSTIPSGGYGFKSGTSMATPHVAGLTALVISQFPDLEHHKVRDRIFSTATPTAATAGKVAYGRIDALSSLEIDEVDPSKPGEIALLTTGLKSIDISWKESGDDGVVGHASRYDVRTYSESMNNENWDLAIPVNFTTEASANGVIKGTISNLDFNQSGYIAIRAFDNVGNSSEISESIAFSVKEAVVLISNEGTIDFFASADSPWNNEVLEDNSFISDSPGSTYENNLDISLITETYIADQVDVIISFDTKYDLETRYDYGHVQIQVDSGDWIELATFNGQQDWQTEQFELRQFLDVGSEYKIRFNMTTDSSVTKDGWSLDNFKILVPKN